MNATLALRIGATTELLAFFILLPGVTLAIAILAWQGKPKNFNRSTYWTAFMCAMLASVLLFVFCQRMHADVRTWQYLVQLSLFVLSVLWMGIAAGCMIGMFIYRRGLASPPTR